jgi:beta-glucanase (GH16 family)
MKIFFSIIILLSIAFIITSSKIDNNRENLNTATYINFPSNPIVKPGYTLDFQEEFNNKALDLTKWPSPTSVTTKYSFNDSCLNLYIDATTKPANGDLVYNFRYSQINTYKKITKLANGSFITAITPTEGYATKYGYFEIRAKLPDCGGGGHCAWWMVGNPDDGVNQTQSAEIDIIEPLFSKVNNSTPKVHPWYDTKCTEWSRNVTNPGYPEKEFHIYGMDWSPTGIKFYYDNQLISSTTNTPAYKMTMMLSIYACNNHSYWSGWDNGVYPKTFSIDYVRVWKLNATSVGNINNIDDTMELYPNPARDKIMMKNFHPNPEPSNIDLIDMAGRKVDGFVLPANVTNYSYNSSALKSGIYFLYYQSQFRTLAKKIMIE